MGKCILKSLNCVNAIKGTIVQIHDHRIVGEMEVSEGEYKYLVLPETPFVRCGVVPELGLNIEFRVIKEHRYHTLKVRAI